MAQLSLTGTAITDSGLIHLAGLAHLLELLLSEASVTEAGGRLATLKVKRPNLKIEVGDRKGRG